MAKPNYADLQKVVREQSLEIEHLRAELAQRDLVISESNDQGFLVESPNPAYTGMTRGVSFVRGWGFVARREGDEKVVNAQLRQIAELKNDFGYYIHEGTVEEYKMKIAPAPDIDERGMPLSEILAGHAESIGG